MNIPLLLLTAFFIQENYLEDPAWKETEALHNRVQADLSIPATLRADLAADFGELRSEINELQKRMGEYQKQRSKYETDGKDFVEKLETHNTEVGQFDSANSAHAGSEPHECPCGEYGRLSAWQSRLAGREQELNKVKAKLAEQWEKAEQVRKELEADAADFAATGLTVYEDELKRIQNEAAEAKKLKAALRTRLEELRKQVASTQEALRTLIKMTQENNRGLDEWAKTSAQTLQDTYERAGMMIADGAIDLMKSAKQARLDEVNRQIARKQQRIRKRKKADAVLAEIKTLKNERDGIAKDTGLLEKIEAAKLGLEQASNVSKDAPAREKHLETIYTLGQEALKSDKVQRALRIGSTHAAVAGHAKTIVDTTYDVVAQLTARRRILQLNRNSEEYLKAVSALSDHMKKLVDQIVQIKKQLGE